MLCIICSKGSTQVQYGTLVYCWLIANCGKKDDRSIDRSMKMNRAFSVTSRKAWTKEERMDGSRLRRLVSSVCGELQNVMVSH